LTQTARNANLEGGRGESRKTKKGGQRDRVRGSRQFSAKKGRQIKDGRKWDIGEMEEKKEGKKVPYKKS